jgi:hypothetical protein
VIVAKALASVSPAARVKVSCWLLICSIIGWPISSLTVFSGGGATAQGILGLSWLALILTCIDIVVTTDVRQEQDEDTGELKECGNCGHRSK